MPFYFIIQIYPILNFFLHFPEFQTKNYYATVSMFILYHYFTFLVIGIVSQRSRENLFIERKKVKIVKEEYHQILENLPEGILIAKDDDKAIYMNQELKQFLNVTGDNYDAGLILKLFKKHCFNNTGSPLKEEDLPLRNSEQNIFQSTSLQEMLSQKDWCKENDQFYELELVSGEQCDDEERIFTHIQKLEIQYKQKSAQMIIIRNISHIIHYEKAKNQNKYLELLTQTMSHEFLTPLNSILHLSAFIEKKLQEKYLKERQITGDMGSQVDKDLKICLDYLNIVRSSASIMSFLVKDLLDLMYIRQNSFNLEKKNFSVIEACQEVIKCYEIQAQIKKIYLKIEVADHIKRKIKQICGDKLRYQQILFNIIQNGVKFTFNGGVKIKLALLSNDNCEECGQLVTMVEDTGSGITKEIQEKLFQLFALMSDINSNTISTQGIGLGLSICKQLVTKLGGQIKINTIVNEGTTVKFSFPFYCHYHEENQHQFNLNSGLLSNSQPRSNPESFCDNMTMKSGYSARSKISAKSKTRTRRFFEVEIFASVHQNVIGKKDDENQIHNRIPTRQNNHKEPQSFINAKTDDTSFQYNLEINKQQSNNLRFEKQDRENKTTNFYNSKQKQTWDNNYTQPKRMPTEHIKVTDTQNDLEASNSLIIDIRSGGRNKSFHSQQPRLTSKRDTQQRNTTDVIDDYSDHKNICFIAKAKHNDLKIINKKNGYQQLNIDSKNNSMESSQILPKIQSSGLDYSVISDKKKTAFFGNFQGSDAANNQESMIDFCSKMQPELQNCQKSNNEIIDSQLDIRDITMVKVSNNFEEYQMRKSTVHYAQPGNFNFSRIQQSNQVQVFAERSDEDDDSVNDYENKDNRIGSSLRIVIDNELCPQYQESDSADQASDQQYNRLNQSNNRSNLKTCSCESSVLIVDDNMFNLIPLELILRELFHIQVDKAMNGQEAVNLFQKNIMKQCCDVKYKLVLMDLNMPVMDGYDATVLIIQSFRRVFPEGVYSNGDQLNIVAVTAFVNDENIRKCIRVGMKKVLHKPVNCEELGSVVDQYFHYRIQQ
ncbi:histidine kinase-dna gyrase b-and hsp90-like domain containing protein [Stylonychia lemnae]|uniref:Histidine kinase-dna gyrase b-and hsp90-like domain containing protein n=1 Tax=Stylonychia lemnae TaxID=5949 RepID=A0A078APR4_STYLE|nr:histidine kinase-dna gyrase b-and hsp90-like domain containing protein [Stylonychia lemnae]|eukprot:CDW84159.1 histidine kinase-dna gyrase b-and hsp90-like domain containing protein [Stylonychia lemnae]